MISASNLLIQANVYLNEERTRKIFLVCRLEGKPFLSGKNKERVIFKEINFISFSWKAVWRSEIAKQS